MAVCAATRPWPRASIGPVDSMTSARGGGGLAEDAPTPLEVLLTTMHLRWQEGKWDEAVALAKAAAPYLHAKAAYGREFRELGALRDEQLDELCAHLSGSGGTAASEGTED